MKKKHFTYSSFNKPFKDSDSCQGKEIGDEISFKDLKGTLLASNTMGITIFDLFSEIIEESDMKKFLEINGIKEQFTGAGLVLRTFLAILGNKCRNFN